MSHGSKESEGTGTCEYPHFRMCVERECSCVAPSMPPAVAPKPAKECTVTVGFAPTSPEMPWLQFNDGACAMSAEIALAVALASLLKLSGPMTPVPK